MSAMTQSRPFTLSEIAARISADLARDASLRNVWITAETADVRLSGGHCYLELIEKDQAGRTLAKMRANIWASVYGPLARQFFDATGRQFGSDMKVMVCVQAVHHPVYGLSLIIVAINPAFTLGDAAQRRQQMIRRLKDEGIIDMNKSLEWPALPMRVAVVSARGAAGYGDFVDQLYSSWARYRFRCRLFPAIMQGEKAAPSIIDELERIASQAGDWDCVVIIRGGGATSDLACFEDYDLAAHVAQFPLPVVIGIGHERDITLLDFVANMRVKTPTAAAEWLIGRADEAMARLQAVAQGMLQAITDRMAGCHRQLSYIAGQLPSLAQTAASRAAHRLAATEAALGAIADRRLRPAAVRLDAIGQSLRQAAAVAIDKNARKLQSLSELLAVLSPQATLRRGYTITRAGGRTVTSAAGLWPGQAVTTIFADGQALSIIENSSMDKNI